MARLTPAAVLLDGGGVLVLPHRQLVAAALDRAGVRVDPAAVPAAHYGAVRALDAGTPGTSEPGYMAALCRALGIAAASMAAAVSALERLADRAASGEILWSEPASGVAATLQTLHAAGTPVVVVTNSDGHGEENLRDAGICQVGAGRGAPIAAVIDSTAVGHAKPDPAIFAVALARAGVNADDVVHVGDMVSTDIAGAEATGITAIHLDPARRCREHGHRHIRSLGGLWRHIAVKG